MVVMLRSLDIPARLVSGYHSGDFDPARNGYVYLENEAHTWVEAFFPGYGWIPFEPTPSQNTFSYGDEAQQPSPTPEPSPTPLPSPTPAPSPTVDPTFSPVAGPILSDKNDRSLPNRLPWLPTMISLLTVGGIVLLVVIWLWGLRGLRPGAALYARALRIGRFWGVDPDPTMTPAEYAAEFARTVPASRGAMRVVAELYTAEQYGDGSVNQSATIAGRAAWKELRGSLVRWRPWRRRHGTSGTRREISGD
jgi:hypothetical protein